ncbi:MAG TPA: SpoIID/LytB domain-containing protein [Solirubrobacterales bacterium]
MLRTGTNRDFNPPRGFTVVGRMGNRLTYAALAAAVGALLAVGASPADAAWVAKGRGFGHGVGMSQYGAYGMAKNGRSHKQILRHYYTGVKFGKAKVRAVRVLITSGLSSVYFSGATRACGKSLKTGKTYSFRIASASRVSLHRPNGSRLTGCGREGAARGGKSVRYVGVGVYRGRLIARAVSGTLYAINRVGIEDYVKGVIPNEVPASWPAAALRAQAVAARSYALATRVNGNGYNLYDDTRSQVYGGKSSEHASTNRAAKATARQVIKHGGKIATAYFFSTSGGQTENSEDVWTSRVPYLRSVKDPADKASPYHRWRVRFSNAQMKARLGAYFSGKLRRIKVIETGASPRIVRARIVGSKGSSVVSGATLRSALGLRSTWVRFKRK